MTTSEKDALHELNMTEEQLAEKQAKVNALLHTQTGPGDSIPANSPKPAKKPRSDKGTKRVKATEPQPVAGALSAEQVREIADLNEAVELTLLCKAQTAAAMERCEENVKRTTARRKDYLSALIR
jgi:hypothetical protein